MLPLRHRGLWIVLSAILVAAVVWSSLQPDFGPDVPANFDKVEHFAAYLGLALWFTGLFARSGYWIVAAALVALGLAIEAAQDAMNLGRSAEALDVLANVLGVMLGLVIALGWSGGWARRFEAWLATR
jgi:VanZ family protein